MNFSKATPPPIKILVMRSENENTAWKGKKRVAVLSLWGYGAVQRAYLINPPLTIRRRECAHTLLFYIVIPRVYTHRQVISLACVTDLILFFVSVESLHMARVGRGEDPGTCQKISNVILKWSSKKVLKKKHWALKTGKHDPRCVAPVDGWNDTRDQLRFPKIK